MTQCTIEKNGDDKILVIKMSTKVSRIRYCNFMTFKNYLWNLLNPVFYNNENSLVHSLTFAKQARTSTEEFENLHRDVTRTTYQQKKRNKSWDVKCVNCFIDTVIWN